MWIGRHEPVLREWFVGLCVFQCIEKSWSATHFLFVHSLRLVDKRYKHSNGLWMELVCDDVIHAL